MENRVPCLLSFLCLPRTGFPLFKRNPPVLLQFQIILSPRGLLFLAHPGYFKASPSSLQERVYSGVMNQTRAQGCKLGLRQGPASLVPSPLKET